MSIHGVYVCIFILGEQTTGKAYIFDCRYSTLCRQVVTDEDGRVQEFDFESDSGSVTLKSLPVDCESGDCAESPQYGIDSVVAIPLEDWSLDLVTPNG